MKKVIISICIMVSLMGVFVNVNASEDQEMITSNQVLEDGFLEETEEEEFLNFSTKVNVDWTVKPQILKRSKGFTKKAGSIIYINLKIFPHKKVRIGVIKGGKVTTGLEKEIPVKDTDTYSVFVQNMTNSTINAKGSYIK